MAETNVHGTAGAVLPDPQAGRLDRVPTKDLVRELAQKASLLAKKEIALAKSEAKEDLRAEIKMASGLGVAGVCALCTLNLLLVAVVFALFEAELLHGWLAALLVAAVVLAIGTIAGLVGWSKRVRKPLSTTRRSIEDGVRLAKERMA
ncbi:MAG TPA: phage holin family protein [Anaeromyxobacteraceae bacterium]|nr:phage holin family protein [Anaeromyxobacteraceae bacterium]